MAVASSPALALHAACASTSSGASAASWAGARPDAEPRESSATPVVASRSPSRSNGWREVCRCSSHAGQAT
eukprot:4034058-Alexandrium_andersonii.AAC.1